MKSGKVLVTQSMFGSQEATPSTVLSGYVFEPTDPRSFDYAFRTLML
jgi:hypothetical protein